VGKTAKTVPLQYLQLHDYGSYKNVKIVYTWINSPRVVFVIQTYLSAWWLMPGFHKLG